MELKIYLKILLKRWWIVIPTFLATVAIAIVFTYTYPPQYSTKATFVIALGDNLKVTEDYISGLSLVSRQQAIANTYTEIAASQFIKKAAAQEIGLEAIGNYEVSSKLVADTNVVEIEVTGPDPEIVRDLANAIGAQIVEFAKHLYEVYPLSPLDEAPLPRRPISPDITLNISLATFFGLVLAVGLAFLVEYLSLPIELNEMEIFLDTETNLYNKRYFLQRLAEEMSRAKRNGYPLSVAFMNIDYFNTLPALDSPQARSEALRKAAAVLKKYVRLEDVVARLDDHIFGFILPDLSGEKAQTVMEELRGKLGWYPFELEHSGLKLNFTGATGVASYDLNGHSQVDLLAMVKKALQKAETTGQGKTCLIKERVA